MAAILNLVMEYGVWVDIISDGEIPRRTDTGGFRKGGNEDKRYCCRTSNDS
jgi:hypothetical protein